MKWDVVVLVASDVLLLETCTDEGDDVDDGNFQVIVGKRVSVWVVADSFDEAVTVAVPMDMAV